MVQGGKENKLLIEWINKNIGKINLTFMLILQKLYYICIVINVATMSQAKLEIIEQSELVSLYYGADTTEEQAKKEYNFWNMEE